MTRSMGYTQSEGLTALRQWVVELQRRVHNPPAMGDPTHPANKDIIITSGSADALCKVLESVLSPGDNVLIENPTFPGPFKVLRPLDCNMIPVNADADGMNPENLRRALSRWSPEDAKNPTSDIPKLLYCVPTCGNPTGSCLTLTRKQEIYKLAQEYDLMILEDDPYYYLQFTEPLVPSFLSLDVDGRVMRLDSFSKVIAPGLRLGFLTGPCPMVQKILYKVMQSTSHPSGISQIFVTSVLKQWGHDGFIARSSELRRLYEDKCQQCLVYLDKHLTGLAEWTKPTGGMFIWIKILGIKDSSDVVAKVYQKGVVFITGSVFHIDSSAPSPFIRLSYILATCKEINKALSILAECLKEEV
ncbi:kynurenine/alpha-aminoadipate aminotransferase, mitochondrial-like [Argopecten irradians]|uniref:kynurenine/alpha-aminoadipate aminotransferase, mitochondrial-like n=1 Tax=Argopecten irradians TaxID=31199 RepID=UPI003714DD84